MKTYSELERFKLLLEYNTELTNDENVNLIFESSPRLLSYLRTLNKLELKKIIDKAVDYSLSNVDDFDGIEGLDNGKKIIFGSADEIIEAFKGINKKSLTGKGLKDLSKSIFNSIEDTDIRRMFIDDFVNTQNNINLFKGKTKQEIKKILTEKGWNFTDELSDAMFKKLNANTYYSDAIRSGLKSNSGAIATLKLITPNLILKRLPDNLGKLQKGDWARITGWLLTGVGDITSIRQTLKNHGVTSAIVNAGTQMIKKWLILSLLLTVVNVFIEIFKNWMKSGQEYENEFEMIVDILKKSWNLVGIEWVIPITVVYSKIRPLLLGSASPQDIIATLMIYGQKIKSEIDKIVQESKNRTTNDGSATTSDETTNSEVPSQPNTPVDSTIQIPKRKRGITTPN